MNTMIRAFGIGVVAGLRSMTAPAAVALSSETAKTSRYAFAVLALGELVGDKLPGAPSRKALLPFAGRIASGAASGAVLGAREGGRGVGLVAGAAGAVVGTLGGAALRDVLATSFAADLPAALLEDAIAMTIAALAVRRG